MFERAIPGILRLPRLIAVAAILFLLPAPANASTHTAAEVLLIYNSNSPISTAIANDYAAKRGVTNILAVSCSDSAISTASETISYANYTAQIANPVSAYLSANPGINFMVLTKGVPIRVSGAPTGSESQPSVDSCLASIDYPTISSAVEIKIVGAGTAGYAWLNRYWGAAVPFSHATFGGYLVTRLDGYTQSDAMSLTAGALSAEAGLIPNGRILLDVFSSTDINDKIDQPFAVTGNIPAEAPYSTWDSDIARADDILEASAMPVDLNLKESFLGNRSNLLGYYSWGSNDNVFTAAAYESLFFAPGSFGDTGVSTSARTFLPTTGGQSLIADLIAHGLTCTKGDINEPLLQSFSSPSVALSRYMSGFTMAESFYAASRFVGWEDIMLGDPLCCPYPANASINPPIQASTYQGSSGVGTEACSEGGLDVLPGSNGSYTEYSNINLTGVISFEARLASASGGATIALHLDSLTGPLVGTCTAPATGAQQVYTDVSCALTGASGVHSVYLVYSTGLELEWLAFQQPSPLLVSLPTPWAGADVGAAGLPGGHIYSSFSNSFTSSGGGAGIGGAADAFHYVYQTGTGNSAIVARVSTESLTNPAAQAGVMVRSGTDPAGPNAAVLVTPGSGITFQWRSSEGGATFSTSVPGAAPAWVRLIQQNGGSASTFLAFYSPDGVNWTQIGAAIAVPMPSSVLTGLAVSSDNNIQVENATFDHVAISTAALPAPLGQLDIGGSIGNGFYDPGTGTLIGVGGSGTQIGGATDSFHFLDETVNGNCTVTALVTTSGTGQAGVMIRGALAVDSIEASVLLTADNTLVFQYRTGNGQVVSTSAALTATPVYVRLTLSGNSIIGFYSYNGVNWVTMGVFTPVTLPPAYYAGLAVAGAGDTATFQQFSITNLPSPWLGTDIGPVGFPGYASYASGVFTVAGSGAYISSTADSFYYAYIPTTGNQAPTAQVTSVGDPTAEARAGIMMRANLNPGSPEACILVKPDGLQFEWRSAQGGASAAVSVLIFAPVYVQLTRTGNVFTGSYSTNGTSWTTVGSATITMPASIETGLAVTSENNAAINQSVFTAVSMPATSGSTAPITSGLQLWLAASSVNTSDTTQVTAQSGNTYVQRWIDQTGNGYDATQATASKQPQFVPGAISGKPVVKFNGGGTVMNTSLPQIAGDKSIFVVMKRIDLISPSGTEISSTQNGAGMFFGNMAGAETEGRLGIAHDLALPGLLNDYMLKSYVRSGSNGTLSINGNSLAAAVPDAAAGSYSLSDGFNFPFSGAIAEVMIYNRALTAPEQQQVENYLAEKYGLWTVTVPVQSGLQLWLTPDAINVNSGSQVRQSNGAAYLANWIDRGVSGFYTAQSQSTYQPLVVSNVINGRSVVRFNGNNNFMTTPLPQITGDKSIFAVHRRASRSIGTELASSTAFNGFFLGDDGLGDETKGRLYVAHDLSLPGLLNQFILKSFIRAGSSETLWVNNSTVTATVSDTAGGTYSLSGGSSTNPTFNPFSGDLGEVLIYNRALGSTEWNTVENYLQDKWSWPAGDLFAVAPDLQIPATTNGAPGPGLRVRMTSPEYAGTAVYHTLYLPTDWQPGRTYPVIVEFAQNGGYSDAYGDTSTGNVEDCAMGYGLSGGQGYIWVSMPTVGGSPLSNQTMWWGSVAATEDYCLKTIYHVCQSYGGDPSAVILAGEGRGGIACNYIGLYDDNIADAWLAFIPHAGYDGQYTTWPYSGADSASALTRLQRLNGRYQHISQESAAVSPSSYLASTGLTMAPYTFRTLPYVNHTPVWPQYPIQLRRDTRAWLQQVVTQKPGTYSITGNVTSLAGAPVPGVQIQSGPTHFTFTDVNGNYVLPGLINSSRTVTATATGYAFPRQIVIISGANVANVNFQSTQ